MRKFRDMISHRADTPRARLASVLYTELVDHGLLRHLWTNEKEIDNGVIRSNHPTRRRLEKFKKSGGAAVLSLRGAMQMAQNVLEIETCEKLGLEVISFPMASSALPSKKIVLDLVEVLERAPRPLMIHCKSGADRTGFVAGIYLMHFKGTSPKDAARQLTWRHAHNKFSKKAVLSEFFALYQPAHEAGIGFLDWVRDSYDPGADAR
ncbi:fused DSP-PTPase phosphatase/NAD kinase-like protein [Marimonas arenosa]|uniref:Tyrosine-protein phosphatase n=1 Tax=Marimonas arenosa TaxID=1795305 RepID=A0AAE4B3W6_9RHOB|nr:tyrosine-protein phosphatase [Marimonas arenosa]MDQ2090468.1 tyrosine-protein phosphatase [Marimonas arenosa]